MELLKRQHTGTTIVELMIVVAIAAIFTAFALPSFQNMIRLNNVSAELNNLMADLQLARVEAVKHGQSIQVCSVDDTYLSCNNGSATPCNGNAYDWSCGWISYYCSGSACGGPTSTNELRVRTDATVTKLPAPATRTLSSGNALVSTGLTSGSNGLSCVTFSNFGFAVNISGCGASPGAITDTASGGGYSSTLCVSAIGNLTIITGGNSTCP
ncbi:MAG: GspH/FimT family pseudopilin [Methylomonas sp.]|jgi:type II secretory pathway pseudopilin PulG